MKGTLTHQGCNLSSTALYLACGEGSILSHACHLSAPAVLLEEDGPPAYLSTLLTLPGSSSWD